jgi:hypothetical protein
MAHLLAAENAVGSKAQDFSESEQDHISSTPNDSDAVTAPQSLETGVVTSFRRRLVWSGSELPPSSSSSTSTDPGPRVSLQDIRKRYKRVLDRSLFTKGSVIRRLRMARRLHSSAQHQCNAYHGEDIILGPDPNTSAVFTSINCVQCREQAEEVPVIAEASEPAATKPIAAQSTPQPASEQAPSSDDYKTSAHGLFGTETLAAPLWGTEAESLSPSALVTSAPASLEISALASDSSSAISPCWLDSPPYSDPGVELGRDQHRIPSLPVRPSLRPGRGHRRNDSHPYLPPRSRLAQPGSAQEPSGIIQGLAPERLYAFGPISEDTLLNGLGVYSSTISSSSISPSDVLDPSFPIIDLSSPGPGRPVVVERGVIENRVASEAHLRNIMGRRQKEATFFCDWPHCGQSFRAKHHLKSTCTFSCHNDFGLTLWN